MAINIQVTAAYDGAQLKQGMRQLDQLNSKVQSTAKKTRSGFSKLKGAAGKATGGGGLFGSFLGGMAASTLTSQLTDVVKAGQESAAAMKVTEQVIKQTGGAAGVSADHVADLANELSRKTGIDDEAIQSGQNLLLTFKNIRNAGQGQAAIFDRASAAALDLSKAGFGSVSSASKVLGKALNDPIKGMGALSRVGVTFSKEQQKQIKDMVKRGDLLGAQQMIMAQIEGKVAGVAEKSASPIEKMNTQLGNMKEQLGIALLPIVEKFAVALGKVADWAGKNQGLLTNLLKVVGALGVAFLVVKGATMAWTAISGVYTAATAAVTAVQWAWNAALTANPIGIVVVAIAAFIAALVVLYKKNETFRKVVQAAFKGVAAAAKFLWNIIKTVFAGVLKAIAVVAPFIIRNFYKPVVTAFSKLASGITGFMAGAFGWVPGIGDKLKSAKEAVAKFADNVGPGMDKIADTIEKKGGEWADKLAGKVGGEQAGAKAEKAGGELAARAKKGMARVAAIKATGKDPADMIAGKLTGKLSSPSSLRAAEKAGAQPAAAVNKGMSTQIKIGKQMATNKLGAWIMSLQMKLRNSQKQLAAASSNVGKSMGGGMRSSLVSGLGAAKTKAVGMLSGLRDRVAKYAPAFSKTGAAVFASMASGAKATIRGRLASALNTGFDQVRSIRDRIAGMYSSFKRAGGHLIKGLKKGWDDAWKAVKDGMAGVLGTIKNWLSKLPGMPKSEPAAKSLPASAARSVAANPISSRSLVQASPAGGSSFTVAPGAVVVTINGVDAADQQATARTVDSAVRAALAELARQTNVSSRARVRV